MILIEIAVGRLLASHEARRRGVRQLSPLLKSVVLAGRVITGDAMFCQRDLCQQINDEGGHYFFEVKDNQPELKKSIEAEFQPAFSPLH